MTNDVSELIDAHAKWLRDRTVVKEIADSEWTEITTPYLDRHNDQLQILIRKSGDGFELSDGGYVLTDLELSGVTFDSKKRQQLLQSTLNGFGVKNVEGVLSVMATTQDFSLRKHFLIQAMLSVNDLFIAAAPAVTSVFSEDVKQWFDENDIRYTSSLDLRGKSGLAHHFEFIIPHSKKTPERVVQLMNRPSRQNVVGTVFRWIDTKDLREGEVHGVTILNDVEKSVKPALLTTLNEYQLRPILWTKRDDFLSYLKA